ncbi:MAG: DUF952 domain-containing protein [Pseudomonadota bacterium]
MIIFKIEQLSKWAAAQKVGVYSGAPIDLEDGFIHFSTAQQVGETLRKHFSGQSGLALIAVDTDKLGEALVWEPSRGGALFPHLYGDLMMDAVLGSTPIGDDGLLPARPEWGLQ